MKIERYKYLKDGKYEVNINNDKYIIYEDIIIKNDLLMKKEISKEELNSLMKDNSFYEAYYKSVKYINTKLRTKKEIEDYLKKNEYDKSIIGKVTAKLEKDKYLDDNTYSKAYVHDQMILKLVGPHKIKNDLLKLKVNENVINNNLEVFTKEIEKEKLDKLIDKEIRLNKNKSSYALKSKIMNSMINKGFTREYIKESLDSIEIDDTALCKSEYAKLYNKLSKKYSGNELEYKIKQKLYQKGFRQN